MRLTVTGEVTPGDYAFKVTVVAGESTVTAMAPFAVKARPEFQFGSLQVNPVGDSALYGGESREVIASVKGSEPLDSVWVTLLKDSVPQTQLDGIWIAQEPSAPHLLKWESTLHGAVRLPGGRFDRR